VERIICEIESVSGAHPQRFAELRAALSSLPDMQEVERTVARVLKQYAAAFCLDCGGCGDGTMEKAAETLAGYVAAALKGQLTRGERNE
jgi:hypothetical protein